MPTGPRCTGKKEVTAALALRRALRLDPAVRAGLALRADLEARAGPAAPVVRIQRRAIRTSLNCPDALRATVARAQAAFQHRVHRSPPPVTLTSRPCIVRIRLTTRRVRPALIPI